MTTINETPGVCGGYPCVNDTRIAVRLLVECRRDHGEAALIEDWVWDGGLTADDITAALAWYALHPERVDEDIERNQRARAEVGLVD